MTDDHNGLAFLFEDTRNRLDIIIGCNSRNCAYIFLQIEFLRENFRRLSSTALAAMTNLLDS